MKNFSEKAKAYALKNALAYEGKAKTGSVISALFNEGLKRSEVGKYSKQINEIVSEVNSLSLSAQQKEFEPLKALIHERQGREGLPELPKAKKGKVMMRFAPSASGPLHIGHAATACISYLYVKKYGGKFYVRIEDTNPENVFKDSYELIKKDAKWLFPGNFVSVQIQSNNMKTYYKYVEKLLGRNRVYVCRCSPEKFKDFVSKKKECGCRNSDKKKNLERWKKMLSFDSNKNFNPGEAVLRLKSGMKDKNPAMRDFPLARINTKKHPLQENKYRVWPLMNLAVAVDDIEQGMTHVIRAKDHRDNAKRQKLIYEVLGLGKKYPWIAFLGRWHFKGMDLSTSKMREEIQKRKYSGWNDKRLPTLVSLKKQGYSPKAFWEFSERVGLSESDKVIDKKEYFKLLNSFNK